VWRLQSENQTCPILSFCKFIRHKVGRSLSLQAVKSGKFKQTFDLMTFGLFNKGSKSTAGMRRQSMLRSEKVVYEPIGYLMELR
jgi:hypothetical protein